MKVAFLTTIFPMKDEYLNDFFKSLLSQTYSNFDIIVINDEYENFNKFKDKYLSLNIIELRYSNTPSKNREYGIDYILNNNYDAIIFGDSDDYFEKNRVEITLKYLSNYDVVVNDLTLFNDSDVYEEKYLSNRVKNLEVIGFNYIKNKNIFGLSNTAIKLIDIERVNFTKDLIAVDWYLFSTLLLKNKKALFTNETTTFYRQYEFNTVGVNQITKEKVLNGLKTKYIHYRELSKIDNKFEKFYKEFKSLFDRVSIDESKLNSYFDYIENLNVKNALWWENIKEISNDSGVDKR